MKPVDSQGFPGTFDRDYDFDAGSRRLDDFDHGHVL